MLERLKRSLVESFVGAIALGWLLAQGIANLVSAFTAPVASWVMRSQYFRFPDRDTVFPPSSLLRDALPEAVGAFASFLVGYLLVRWLYFKPLRKEMPDSTPDPKV